MAEIQKRRNISISDPIREKAKKIGGGYVSNGVRKAVSVYDEFLALVELVDNGEVRQAKALAQRIKEKHGL